MNRDVNRDIVTLELPSVLPELENLVEQLENRHPG
jgi:hypothetical protein